MVHHIRRLPYLLFPSLQVSFVNPVLRLCFAPGTFTSQMSQSPVELGDRCSFDLYAAVVSAFYHIILHTHSHLGRKRILMKLKYVLDAEKFTLAFGIALHAGKISVQY